VHLKRELHLYNNIIQTEALICPFVLQMCTVFNNNLCESYVYWTVHHLDS